MSNPFSGTRRPIATITGGSAGAADPGGAGITGLGTTRPRRPRAGPRVASAEGVKATTLDAIWYVARRSRRQGQGSVDHAE